MEKKAISHVAFVNGVRIHYGNIVSFLKPWEEIPFFYFFSSILIVHAKRRREDYKEIQTRKPSSSIGVYHRYSAYSGRGYTLLEALGIIKEKNAIYQVYLNPFHVAHLRNSIRIEFHHFLINASITNNTLYAWYLLHLGIDGTPIPKYVEEAVEDLKRDDADSHLFHIRQRNEVEFSKLSLEQLEEDSLTDRMVYSPVGCPHSLMSEIFLDGWEAKYPLAREMQPMNVLSLLPSLFWEGKFDEILWLTEQRVPYTEEEIKEFAVFGLTYDELITIIGKDRPLLSPPLEKCIFAINGDEQESSTDEIKDRMRTWAEDIVSSLSRSTLHRDSLILRGISHSAITNILEFFFHGQIMIACGPGDMNVKFLSAIVEKRNDMINRFASTVHIEESIFAECCSISEDSCLLVDGDYYCDNDIEEKLKVTREKAAFRIQGRLFLKR